MKKFDVPDFNFEVVGPGVLKAKSSDLIKSKKTQAQIKALEELREYMNKRDKLNGLSLRKPLE